mmetsp:Transcript_27203/g.93503  ORF Transcript_27203/g.93503 Transcript_27203/m.93503 type:complete len:211 (+) Transcript_27203:709-1341(+)
MDLVGDAGFSVGPAFHAVYLYYLHGTSVSQNRLRLLRKCVPRLQARRLLDRRADPRPLRSRFIAPCDPSIATRMRPDDQRRRPRVGPRPRRRPQGCRPGRAAPKARRLRDVILCEPPGAAVAGAADARDARLAAERAPRADKGGFHEARGFNKRLVVVRVRRRVRVARRGRGPRRRGKSAAWQPAAQPVVPRKPSETAARRGPAAARGHI